MFCRKQRGDFAMALFKSGNNAIIDQINIDDLTEVARQLVQMPSINPPGNEAEVAEYVRNYMEAKGIQTYTQEVLPERYNVIARLPGEGQAPPLLFSSHMDVVPVSSYEAKRWDYGPFSGEISNGFLYGRGAADAKGGLASVMVAMGTLAANKVRPKGDIILAATVDEENLMMGARSCREFFISDVERAICCEPTNLEVQICSKGRMWAEVTVFGQTAHASVKGAGVNAIHRALKLMNKMEEHSFSLQKHPVLGETFWQTTMIHGGEAWGVIPDHCTLNVDVRLVPGQTPDCIWQEMENIFRCLKNEIPDFQAEINELERREPWEICRDDKIVRTVAQSCSQVGIPVTYSGYIGTAECTVYRRRGIKGVIFGPGKLQDNVYKENERVSLDELLKASQIYLATMLNWEG